MLDKISWYENLIRLLPFTFQYKYLNTDKKQCMLMPHAEHITLRYVHNKSVRYCTWLPVIKKKKKKKITYGIKFEIRNESGLFLNVHYYNNHHYPDWPRLKKCNLHTYNSANHFVLYYYLCSSQNLIIRL